MRLPETEDQYTVADTFITMMTTNRNRHYQEGNLMLSPLIRTKGQSRVRARPGFDLIDQLVYYMHG